MQTGFEIDNEELAMTIEDHWAETGGASYAVSTLADTESLGLCEVSLPSGDSADKEHDAAPNQADRKPVGHVGRRHERRSLLRSALSPLAVL